jgi:hypothetical protein
MPWVHFRSVHPLNLFSITLHSISCWLAVVALLSAPARSQTTTTNSGLQIEGDPTLTLDPACNACQGASRELKLRNNSAQTVSLSFTHGAITSEPKNKPFLATVKIEPLDDKKNLDATRVSLNSHESVWIRFAITGVLGEATWTVPLYNQGVQFAELKVVNTKPDFAVKLDTGSDNPELTFERGVRPTNFVLRNDTDTGASVIVSYTVNGHTAKIVQGQGCGAISNGSCLVKIPSHGIALLTLTPPLEWFVLPPVPASLWRFWTLITHPMEWGAWFLSRAGALLKDQTAEGRLLVQMASSSCLQDPGAPILSFKVITHLAAFSKDVESLGGTLIIAFTLLLGGVLSLFLNFFLPIQVRRHNLKVKLQQAGRKISDLSLELDSRVRVPVGVERQRIRERIKGLSVLNPQFGPELTEIEQSLERLTTRLDLLDQMQRSLAGYWRSRQYGLPATQVRQIEDLRKQAIDLLQKSDPSDGDLQKILGLLQEISRHQTSLGQTDVAFAKVLSTELVRRKAQQVTVPPTGPLTFAWAAVPGFPAGFFLRFSGLIVALGQELAAAPNTVEEMQPEKYASLDALRNRLDLLEDYQKILPTYPAPTPPFILASERLLTELQNISWDALARADRIVREMQEGIFPEDVVNSVKEGQVKVKVDRIFVRQYEPAELFLEFANNSLKNAAAREEFTYRWTFDHDNLTEDGWSVSHYFPSLTVLPVQTLRALMKSRSRKLWARILIKIQTGTFPPPPADMRPPYNVHVTLIRDYDGEPIPHEVPLREGGLNVYPQIPPRGHALAAELFRLILALGLAVLGLVAGAKDQILKLDTIPALIAVFLLGVGADQIKNLLTQQPPGK